MISDDGAAPLAALADSALADAALRHISRPAPEVLAQGEQSGAQDGPEDRHAPDEQDAPEHDHVPEGHRVPDEHHGPEGHRAPDEHRAPDARRAWEVVLQSVEADLLDGRLRPGDHLPPERQLASDLGVGRSSVREAVRVLEVLGLVRTATGSGPTAGAIIVATPRGGMSALMRLQVAAQGFAVADVVKTRLVLEASVASDLAAASATADVRADVSLPASGIPFSRSGPQNAAVTARTGSGLAGVTDRLAPARQLLDAMDSPDLTAAEFLALDAQFHVSLAEASGNQVVAAMMAGLRNAIESYVLSASANLTSWPTTSARLRAEHRGILASIDDRDAVDAVTRVRAHITGYYAQSQLAPAATLAPASAATPTPTSPAHDRH